MAIVGGTFNYSGDPRASAKDAVRFLIGDTDSRDQLLSDQEIDYLVEAAGSPREAAAQACESLAAGRDSIDKEIDDLVIKGRQHSEHWNELADRIRRRRTGSRMGVFAGGVSISDGNSRDLNSDRPAPAFDVGQFDNPAVGGQRGDGDSILVSSSTMRIH